MKLFVTGGTGFIGGHFINILPNEFEIFAIYRNKKNTKIELNKHVNWVKKEFDYINSSDLKDIDAIIHFASAGVSPQKATWEELYYFNVHCTLKLLRAAAQAGVNKIIMAGSYMEYGLSANIHEYIPPTAALQPTTAYASSKAAAFELAHAFCLNSKISLTYNRIFNVFGEGQFIGNLWPSLQKAAKNNDDFYMTSGTQIRDFIEVNKVALAFLQDLNFKNKDIFLPRVKNICSGNGQSILEFAKFWWRNWNAKGRLLPGKLLDRKNEPIRFVGKV